jgi:hypothetical protein
VCDTQDSDSESVRAAPHDASSSLVQPSVNE